VLRRIFEPKRDEVRRKLHNEELHNLYPSPSYNWNDEVTEDEVGRSCSTIGVEDECMWNIGGKAKRK
jgi:hypothetical protein